MDNFASDDSSVRPPDDGLALSFDDDPDTRPVLPGYHAERLLGTGASAQVWLVQHETTGRLLAAKCFPPEESLTGASDASLARELRILANFTHDHLLTVHSAAGLGGAWTGGRALLMEYAPGGSLAALVAARGPLSIGECVTVLTPLAQVLGYLHSEGVAHRDVSPGNVLFTAQGKPLLADFGVARMVGDAVQFRTGTQGFTADAAAYSGDGGEAALDPAGDVYAAAAVGWFALTGQVPRETEFRPPLSALVPGVPEELAAALEAGLQEVPMRRPTALEFAQAVYRSAPAAVIDLSASVHPSVLPDLLTRRQVRRPTVHWYRPGSWTRLRQLSRPGHPEGRRHGSAGFRRRGWRRVSGRGGQAGSGLAGGGPAGRGPAGRSLAGDGVAGAGSVFPGSNERIGAAGMGMAARLGDGTGAGGPSRRDFRPRRRYFRRGHGGVRRRDWSSEEGQAHAGGREEGQARARSREEIHLRASGMVRMLRTFASAVVLLLVVSAGMLIWRPDVGGTGRLAPVEGAGGPEPPEDALATLAVPDTIRAKLGAEDPAEALGALAWLRSYAFSSGQADLLKHVDIADSPAMAADAAVAALLQKDKHRLTGLESQVLSSHELADDLPDSARLNATTVTSGFAEQDQQGVVVRSQPDAATQELLFVLQREEQGHWRIAEVHLPAN
ncbi:protein kinase domain-containing protein [Arthrobacter sp. A5]|uniref:serine/threonine-protein kinase n=1 Tax=Arthrobacter sp. A5 TaxID=576926 RepID=UPI003DA8E9FE